MITDLLFSELTSTDSSVLRSLLTVTSNKSFDNDWFVIGWLKIIFNDFSSSFVLALKTSKSGI